MLASSRRVQAHAAPQEDVFEIDFKDGGGAGAGAANAENEQLDKDKTAVVAGRVAASSPRKRRRTGGEQKLEPSQQQQEQAQNEQQEQQEQQEHDVNIDYASTVLDSLHTRAEGDRRLAEAFTIFSREVSHLIRPRGAQNENLRSEVSTLLRDLEETRKAKKGAALVIQRQEKEKKRTAEEHATRLQAAKQTLTELRADLEGELSAAHQAFATEKAAAEKLHSAITLELDAERKRNGQLEVQCETMTKAGLEAQTKLDDAMERLVGKEKQLAAVSEAHEAMEQSHEKQCKEITTLIKYKDEIGQHVWSLTDKANELGAALKSAEGESEQLRGEKAVVERKLAEVESALEGELEGERHRPTDRLHRNEIQNDSPNVSPESRKTSATQLAKVEASFSVEKEKYAEKEAMLVSLVNKEAEEKAAALKRVEEATAATDKVAAELNEVREAFAVLKAQKEGLENTFSKLSEEKKEEAQKALALDRDIAQLQSEAAEQEHVREKLERALVHTQGEAEAQRARFVKLEEKTREELERAGMRDEEHRVVLERM